MKHKFFFFLFTIFTICIILFSACKKETQVDYRDKWVGEYEGIHRTPPSPMGFYPCKIYVTLHGDSLVYITVESEGPNLFGFNKEYVKVNSDGSFGDYYLIAYSYGGIFYSDSIRIVHYSSNGYYGKKIKND